MKNKTLALILGIRPDVIRASLILKSLRSRRDVRTVFIWSGQHYSDNLKDVFFRDLRIAPPDVELNASGRTDAELVGSIITRLSPVLQKLNPAAAVFLGDTNTVMGSLAAAQLTIPVVHIEGCMRSYDWRMPEEKYRTVIDHLSDVIYAYFPEYKRQGIAEGLNPSNIVVVGNLIVDVLDEYYFKVRKKFDRLATSRFFASRGIERYRYYLMTCHRRENIGSKEALASVLALAGSSQRTVYFPAGYRTQACLKAYKLKLPPNVIMVDPIGYTEMLLVMVNAAGVITDSGTVVEETAVLGVPAVQMRMSTERPQVYDCKACVKFDPSQPGANPPRAVLDKLEELRDKRWEHRLGDGKASQRVVTDLLKRLQENRLACHRPQDYHIPVQRSFRGDGW